MRGEGSTGLSEDRNEDSLLGTTLLPSLESHSRARLGQAHHRNSLHSELLKDRSGLTKLALASIHDHEFGQRFLDF